MTKLVKFQTHGGSIVWINPNHVQSVSASREYDGFSIVTYNDGTEDYHCVEGSPDKVAGELNAPFEKFYRRVGYSGSRV